MFTFTIWINKVFTKIFRSCNDLKMRYGPCWICVIFNFSSMMTVKCCLPLFLSIKINHMQIMSFLWTVCLRSVFFNRHKCSYTNAKLETKFIFLLFKTLYVFHRDVLEFINFIIKYSFYANYFGSALWRLTVEYFIYSTVSHRVLYNWINKQEPIVNCQNLCTNLLYMLSYLNNRICSN